MGRDTERGLQFSLPYFFGGAQLLVRTELAITTADGLDGGVACVQAGTTIERILADHLKTIGIEHTMVSLEKLPKSSPPIHLAAAMPMPLGLHRLP